MENMASCVDEFAKIAASKKEAPYQQTRSGRRPIRVDTLLKKANLKEAAASKELGKGIWEFLKRHKKPLGLFGGGVAAGKVGEEYLVEPMQLGYKMKAQGYGG